MYWVYRLGLWCLTPFQLYFRYTMAVSIIGGGKRSTRINLRPTASHGQTTSIYHIKLHRVQLPTVSDACSVLPSIVIPKIYADINLFSPATCYACPKPEPEFSSYVVVFFSLVKMRSGCSLSLYWRNCWPCCFNFLFIILLFQIKVNCSPRANWHGYAFFFINVTI